MATRRHFLATIIGLVAAGPREIVAIYRRLPGPRLTKKSFRWNPEDGETTTWVAPLDPPLTGPFRLRFMIRENGDDWVTLSEGEISPWPVDD